MCTTREELPVTLTGLPKPTELTLELKAKIESSVKHCCELQYLLEASFLKSHTQSHVTTKAVINDEANKEVKTSKALLDLQRRLAYFIEHVVDASAKQQAMAFSKQFATKLGKDDYLFRMTFLGGGITSEFIKAIESEKNLSQQGDSYRRFFTKYPDIADFLYNYFEQDPTFLYLIQFEFKRFVKETIPDEKWTKEFFNKQLPSSSLIRRKKTVKDANELLRVIGVVCNDKKEATRAIVDFESIYKKVSGDKLNYYLPLIGWLSNYLKIRLREMDAFESSDEKVRTEAKRQADARNQALRDQAVFDPRVFLIKRKSKVIQTTHCGFFESSQFLKNLPDTLWGYDKISSIDLILFTSEILNDPNLPFILKTYNIETPNEDPLLDRWHLWHGWQSSANYRKFYAAWKLQRAYLEESHSKELVELFKDIKKFNFKIGVHKSAIEFLKAHWKTLFEALQVYRRISENEEKHNVGFLLDRCRQLNVLLRAICSYILDPLSSSVDFLKDNKQIMRFIEIIEETIKKDGGICERLKVSLKGSNEPGKEGFEKENPVNFVYMLTRYPHLFDYLYGEMLHRFNDWKKVNDDMVLSECKSMFSSFRR